jgi:hypothetical protein
MALFAILIVALVVGLTWWDWRDIERESGLPQWIGGLALAGIAAASLTGFTSMGSILYAHTVGELQAGFGSPSFWPQCVFLLCGLGVIILSVRKKSMRTLMLLAGVLTFGLVLGLALLA